MTSNLLQNLRTVSRSLASILVLTAAFGMGVALVSVVPAQAGRHDEKDNTAYKIKRIYKTGDKDRYRIRVKMSMDSPDMPVDMVQTVVLKETTKEADDDGTYTLVTEFESASMKMNGMEMDLSAMLPKITTTRDKNGKTDAKTEGGTGEGITELDGPMKMINGFSTAFLPTKPVKIGDSWEVDPSALGPDAPADLQVTGKASLVSVETVKGVKIAKIKAVLETLDKDNTRIHSENTLLIDMATGKILDFVSKTGGDTSDGKISIEMTQKMLGPGDSGDGKDVFKADSSVEKP